MIADVHSETDAGNFENLPVLALCGYSGAGKTTLIERLVGLLYQRGLSVAVIKHDVHGLTIDREGKDSDRFYKAGADVYMRGAGEGFIRLHENFPLTIEKQLFQLARRYDVVLVEGHKQTPLPKLWLLNENEIAAPEDIRNVLAVLKRDQDRVKPALEILDRQLRKAVENERVFGCVLIGGKSSRMGYPKHLLVSQSMTWLERIVSRLEPVCSTIVIAGSGHIPERLAQYPQLPDAPDAVGPLAGILSAMRWFPDASWLVAACDMPDMSHEALTWLLSQRKPGCWAVIPQNAEDAICQPLLAYYHARCGRLLSDLDKTGGVGPSVLIDRTKTESPKIPRALAGAWRNINTPSERAAIADEDSNVMTAIKMR